MPSGAAKLLERMRKSKSGWKRKDIDALYKGFGFEIRPGRSHDIVTHPDYPQLRDTLPRHNELAKSYVAGAVKLVDRLMKLQAEEEKSDE